MFGFPNHISEYGLKEYLRIVVIVCAYALARPIFEKIFFKLSERGRLREKRRREDELARRYKEQRVKERLGISTDTIEKDGLTPEAETEASAKSTSAKTSSVSSLLRRKEPKKETKMQKILNDFDSDEDVSDLIG